MISKMLTGFIVILKKKQEELKIIIKQEHKQTYEEYAKERLKVEKLLK
jgi:hypothetical protein